LEDVNTIFLSEDQQELVKTDLTKVCRRKYAWYEVHKNPGHDSWIKDTAKQVFKHYGMKVTISNLCDNAVGRRRHCIVSLGKEYAYNSIAGNLKKQERAILGVTLEIRHSITTDMENDQDHWRIIEFSANLVDGSRRKEGRRFAVKMHRDVGFVQNRKDNGIACLALVMPRMHFKSAMMIACDLAQQGNISHSDVLAFTNECMYKKICKFFCCV
jgi:hypothetical protein